jgi:hypothetical protein
VGRRLVAAEGISVGCRLGLAPASAVAEWAHRTDTGVAGARVIGAVIIGIAGARVIGMVVIGAAIGATGTVIRGSLIVPSLLAASAFPGGGVGAGVGVGATRTAITAITRTITTGTVTVSTATDPVATAMITVSTATAASQGSLSCSADSPKPAITVALLTGSWGLRRGQQFEPTSASTEM